MVTAVIVIAADIDQASTFYVPGAVLSMVEKSHLLLLGTRF